MIDDRAYVQRAQQGDNDAFDCLVTEYSPRIYHMLLQLCNGDRDMASELTQEACVKAYQRLDSFAGASSFYTWLYRLARNRAIDVLKRKQPRACDPFTLDRGSHSNSPSAPLELHELQTHVHSALAQLSTEQREIILLRDFDQRDYHAIAELLDIAEGTVKSRLNRARTALRQQLIPYMTEAATASTAASTRTQGATR